MGDVLRATLPATVSEGRKLNGGAHLRVTK